MTSDTSPALVCASCRGVLVSDPEGLRCDACGARFAIRDGIVIFAQGDPFYDTYVEEHVPFAPDPPRWKGALLRVLPFWSWREWRFFRTHLRPGLAVLDVGCGRGKAWFTGEGRFVAGVDPCWPVLPECAAHYDLVAQASIGALPFRDSTFDLVVTSHVLGHVPGDEKDVALAEVARVLRPGGAFVSVIETDSTHPRVLAAKVDEQLYRINFIETDGHVGLEPVSALLERLARHGLRPTDVRKMESGVLHLRMYAKYFGTGYPERDAGIRRRIRAWDRLQRRRLLMLGYEVAMGGYHRFVEQRTTPADHAMFVMVRAVRRPA